MGLCSGQAAFWQSARHKGHGREIKGNNCLQMKINAVCTWVRIPHVDLWGFHTIRCIVVLPGGPSEAAAAAAGCCQVAVQRAMKWSTCSAPPCGRPGRTHRRCSRQPRHRAGPRPPCCSWRTSSGSPWGTFSPAPASLPPPSPGSNLLHSGALQCGTAGAAAAGRLTRQLPTDCRQQPQLISISRAAATSSSLRNTPNRGFADRGNHV